MLFVNLFSKTSHLVNQVPVYKKMIVPTYYLYAKNRGGTVVGDRIEGGDRTPHSRWGPHSCETHSKWRPHSSKRGSHGR